MSRSLNNKGKSSMIIKAMQDVLAQPVRMEGAKDVTVRVLIGPQDNIA